MNFNIEIEDNIDALIEEEKKHSEEQGKEQNIAFPLFEEPYEPSINEVKPQDGDSEEDRPLEDNKRLSDFHSQIIKLLNEYISKSKGRNRKKGKNLKSDVLKVLNDIKKECETLYNKYVM